MRRSPIVHYRRVGRDVDVITGTLGHLSYLSAVGAKVKLSLGRKDSGGAPSLIPVPEFYWKVVHDPAEDAAVVFVGLNDPHFAGDAEAEEQICPNVCEEAAWLFFRRKEATKGYTYCCTYQDFRLAVPWAPELSAGGGDPELLRNILTVD